MFKTLSSSSKQAPSWQEVMLSASHEAFRAAYNKDNASLILSLQCSDSASTSGESCFCNSDSNAQLLLKILRWIKLIVLKLAASYYALPIVLALLPLTIGLIVGFMLGIQASRGRNSARKFITRPSFWSLNGGLGRAFAVACSFCFKSSHRDDEKRTTPTLPCADTPQPRRNHPPRFPETEQEMREREALTRQDLNS
jgi:hypothetical protein